LAFDRVNPSAKATAVSSPLPLPSATTAGLERDNSARAALCVDFDADGFDPADQFLDSLRPAVGHKHGVASCSARELQLSSAIRSPAFICALARAHFRFRQGLDGVG